MDIINSTSLLQTCGNRTSFLYTDNSKIFYLTIIIAYSLMLFASISLNILFLFVIKKQKRVYAPDKYLVILSTSDLLICLLNGPVQFAIIVFLYKGTIYCWLMDTAKVIGYSLGIMSICALFTIALWC